MLARDPSKLERLLIALALTFGWLGAISLALQRSDPLSLAAMAVLSVAAIVAHLWLDRFAHGRDPFLLPLTTLLTAFGLLVIARVAPNFLPRQLLSLGVATAAVLAVAASRDRLRWLRRFKYTWLIAAFVLLLATLAFGVNPSGFGARLWLSVAGLFVQPSEILRLLVIAFLAAYFAERLNNAPFSILNSPFSIQSLAPTIAMWLVALALLVTQQDLGAASLLLITFAFMLYLATASARLPLILLGALLAAGGIGYFLSARVAQRLNIWLNPWADPQGSAFQIAQSLIAVASGGVFGQGINQGRPDYVPAVHTDFPFVVVAEEFGLLGAVAVLACFGVLSLRGWRIALRARTAYGMLLAGGLAAAITVQVFVIIGGNLNLAPLTGVTLPFVSYGGSSLLVSYIAVGLLIRLSADHQADAPAPNGTGNGIRTPFSYRYETSIAVRRAMALCAMVFALLGLGAGIWSVGQASALTARNDNPRRVEAEWAIARGAIFARDGTALATSQMASAHNDTRRYTRVYSHTESAPAIGYYSQRYGAGGIELFADAALRGQRTFFDQLLHRPQIGAPITTTLDPVLQKQLFGALQSANPTTITKGAAVVMDWRTGEVLALVSTPSFDPNTLDEDWEDLRKDPNAPLVNRATQGLYQPGLLLQWFRETEHAIRNTPYSDSSFIPSSGSGQAFHLSSLNLHKPAPFELPNEAVPLPATATYSETIGQGTLRVTPLRVATTAAMLATGKPVTPTLLHGRRTTDDRRQATDHRPSSIVVFAQIGPDRHVGWFVHVGDERVTVIALEQRTPDEAALRRVASAARL